MLAAGHETTATSLCWAYERILNHPEVEARLRAELAGVLHDRPLTAEDLPRLEYLDATIKEVLRMRPVIPTVARKLTAPMKIREWTIPAGVLLAPAINMIHWNEDIYPEAESFKPERFLGKKQDPYTYFPFGGGTRRCIGMAFALYEMKIVLATVLRRTKLKLPRQGTLATQLRTFVMAPRTGRASSSNSASPPRDRRRTRQPRWRESISQLAGNSARCSTATVRDRCSRLATHTAP